MSDLRPVGKLGCLPGSIPVGLRELPYYAAGPLPKAPPYVTAPAFGDWGMLANDTLGDCGVAGLEHGFEADATIVADRETFPTADQASAYYLTYTGGQDSGVVLSSYLAHVRSAGYYGHTVDSYAPVAVHDIPTLHTAIYLYGFVYTGITVTAAMQTAFANHQPWTMATAQGSILGGHCVPLIGYDDAYLYAVTWGGVQAISYGAWHNISTESWAVLTGEFVAHNGDGRGISLPALHSDLNRLSR